LAELFCFISFSLCLLSYVVNNFQYEISAKNFHMSFSVRHYFHKVNPKFFVGLDIGAAASLDIFIKMFIVKRKYENFGR
jgi:uncharacterized membrane protein